MIYTSCLITGLLTYINKHFFVTRSECRPSRLASAHILVSYVLMCDCRVLIKVYLLDYLLIHRVSKTFHLLLAITLTYLNGFFGRNVTDKVSNQKMLYCATSSNLCFYTTWQNGKTRKSHFSLLVHCQNSTSRCLISSFFLLTTHTHTAVWLSA